MQSLKCVLKNENIPGLMKCTLAIDLKIND